ncbi:hypothetical protein EYF80_022749 [Liparis tanakae]|uniref:Uncharacterized protein n=1 Tax=Liparis tanakae TaxID=230148 RepID=A0A4Z2HMA6_9TELE|nr:hypothetical protein EYF80_022749 [Liparis tanakae]
MKPAGHRGNRRSDPRGGSVQEAEPRKLTRRQECDQNIWGRAGLRNHSFDICTSKKRRSDVVLIPHAECLGNSIRVARFRGGATR